MIRPSVTGQAGGSGGEIWADDRPAVAGTAVDPPPATGEVDYRWVANYQRVEIRYLEAKVSERERRLRELERQLRWRTPALLVALVLGGSSTLGATFLATTARLDPPPTEATSVTAAPAGLERLEAKDPEATPAPPLTRR